MSSGHRHPLVWGSYFSFPGFANEHLLVVTLRAKWRFFPCRTAVLCAAGQLCVHSHTCRHTLAHWHVLSASHTLLLVCCKTGRMLMFPGQMWQDIVKGQSLNESLWELPPLLTISLQLIRQGITALAVSLHHFLPLPFTPEPPAHSARTNQLSMKIQIGSPFLESSFSLAPTPKFHRHTSACPSCFSSPCLCLARAEIRMHD